MKILLFSRAQTGYDPADVEALLCALQASGLDWALDSEFASLVGETAGRDIPARNVYDPADQSVAADMAVSYGGDGTFLDCVRVLGRRGMPVLGINSGRLGFLANVPKEGMAHAFDDIRAGRFAVQPRTMLHAAGDFPAAPEYPFAFNEFTLQRNGSGMISVEARIDGEMVATYWSDGVILATASGSTAYALSVGGPVVAPGCGCFVLAPIAPHNLTMRPVVIPDSSEVTFRVGTRDDKLLATLDNTAYEVADGATFTLRRAENSVFLVQLQNISFYQTLRNKMLWGIDRRDNDK